jgi:uncharacterized protein (UPF0333 family)
VATVKHLKGRHNEAGQTSTEYMLLVSVIVIAVVAAAYAFVPGFTTGVYDLSHDVSDILVKHGSVKGGFGLAANTADSNGNGSVNGAGTTQSGATPAYDPNGGAE